MNFLDHYVHYRDEQTDDYIPDWFFNTYEGNIRSMSPVALTYFLAELVVRSSTAQRRTPPYGALPRMPKGGRKGRDLSNTSQEEFQEERRYFQEAQRIYYKLLGKMRRRHRKDILSCDMHMERHLLEQGELSDYEIWKELEIEGKSPVDPDPENPYIPHHSESAKAEAHRRRIGLGSELSDEAADAYIYRSDVEDHAGRGGSFLKTYQRSPGYSGGDSYGEFLKAKTDRYNA